jgi:hypothetical protein
MQFAGDTLRTSPVMCGGSGYLSPGRARVDGMIRPYLDHLMIAVLREHVMAGRGTLSHDRHLA